MKQSETRTTPLRIWGYIFFLAFEEQALQAMPFEDPLRTRNQEKDLHCNLSFSCSRFSSPGPRSCFLSFRYLKNLGDQPVTNRASDPSAVDVGEWWETRPSEHSQKDAVKRNLGEVDSGEDNFSQLLTKTMHKKNTPGSVTSACRWVDATSCVGVCGFVLRRQSGMETQKIQITAYNSHWTSV